MKRFFLLLTVLIGSIGVSWAESELSVNQWKLDVHNSQHANIHVIGFEIPSDDAFSNSTFCVSVHFYATNSSSEVTYLGIANTSKPSSNSDIIKVSDQGLTIGSGLRTFTFSDCTLSAGTYYLVFTTNKDDVVANMRNEQIYLKTNSSYTPGIYYQKGAAWSTTATTTTQNTWIPTLRFTSIPKGFYRIKNETSSRYLLSIDASNNRAAMSDASTKTNAGIFYISGAKLQATATGSYLKYNNGQVSNNTGDETTFGFAMVNGSDANHNTNAIALEFAVNRALYGNGTNVDMTSAGVTNIDNNADYHWILESLTDAETATLFNNGYVVDGNLQGNSTDGYTNSANAGKVGYYTDAAYTTLTTAANTANTTPNKTNIDALTAAERSLKDAVVLPTAGQYYRLNNVTVNSGNNYVYVNGSNVAAGENSTISSIFCFDQGTTNNTYAIVASNGYVFQQPSSSSGQGNQVTIGTISCDFTTSIVSNQHYFGIYGGTDVNGHYLHDDGFSKVVGWNSPSSSENSRWYIVPVTDYDCYKVVITLPDGVTATPTVTYSPKIGSYSGLAAYDGGFIAVSTGTTIATSEIFCSTVADNYVSNVVISSDTKTITVTYSPLSGITSGFYRVRHCGSGSFINASESALSKNDSQTDEGIYYYDATNSKLQNYKYANYIKEAGVSSTDASAVSFTASPLSCAEYGLNFKIVTDETTKYLNGSSMGLVDSPNSTTSDASYTDFQLIPVTIDAYTITKQMLSTLSDETKKAHVTDLTNATVSVTAGNGLIVGDTYYITKGTTAPTTEISATNLPFTVSDFVLSSNAYTPSITCADGKINVTYSPNLSGSWNNTMASAYTGSYVYMYHVDKLGYPTNSSDEYNALYDAMAHVYYAYLNAVGQEGYSEYNDCEKYYNDLNTAENNFIKAYKVVLPTTGKVYRIIPENALSSYDTYANRLAITDNKLTSTTTTAATNSIFKLVGDAANGYSLMDENGNYLQVVTTDGAEITTGSTRATYMLNSCGNKSSEFYLYKDGYNIKSTKNDDNTYSFTSVQNSGQTKDNLYTFVFEEVKNVSVYDVIINGCDDGSVSYNGSTYKNGRFIPFTESASVTATPVIGYTAGTPVIDDTKKTITVTYTAGAFYRLKNKATSNYVISDMGTYVSHANTFKCGASTIDDFTEKSIFHMDAAGHLRAYKTGYYIMDGIKALPDANTTDNANITVFTVEDDAKGNEGYYNLKEEYNDGSAQTKYLYGHSDCIARNPSVDDNCIWALEPVTMDTYTISNEESATVTITAGKGLIVDDKYYIVNGSTPSASDFTVTFSDASVTGYVTIDDNNIITVHKISCPVAGKFYKFNCKNGKGYLLSSKSTVSGYTSRLGTGTPDDKNNIFYLASVGNETHMQGYATGLYNGNSGGQPIQAASGNTGSKYEFEYSTTVDDTNYFLVKFSGDRYLYAEDGYTTTNTSTSENTDGYRWQITEVSMKSYTFATSGLAEGVTATTSIDAGYGLMVGDKLYLTEDETLDCSKITGEADGYNLSSVSEENGVITLTFTVDPTVINKQTLFNSVAAKYPYRIPAITQLADGRLLALSDYRYSGNDIGLSTTNSGRVDVVGKVSEDGGKTWGKLLTIAKGRADGSYFSGFGDAAIVTDWETGETLLMTCYGKGNQSFWSGAQGSARWLAAKNDTVFTLQADSLTGVAKRDFLSGDNVKRGWFFSSGRICQSKLIKNTGVTDAHYRIYSAICAQKTGDSPTYSYVLYSDDFGKTWAVLGGTETCPATGGNECKVEELPDGRVILSSRKANGRYFNIFAYTDAATAAGSWGTCTTNTTIAQNDNKGTNGEILIVPVKTNDANATKAYLAIQSAPNGDARSHVSIYYKVLNDYSDVKDVEAFATDSWVKGKEISSKSSAYSTMVLMQNHDIAFLYEENNVPKSGSTESYDIKYLELTLETLTGDAYTYDDDETSALTFDKACLTSAVNAGSKYTIGDGLNTYSISEDATCLGIGAAMAKQTYSDVLSIYQPTKGFYRIKFNGISYLTFGESAISKTSISSQTDDQIVYFDGTHLQGMKYGTYMTGATSVTTDVNSASTITFPATLCAQSKNYPYNIQVDNMYMNGAGSMCLVDENTVKNGGDNSYYCNFQLEAVTGYYAIQLNVGDGGHMVVSYYDVIENVTKEISSEEKTSFTLTATDLSAGYYNVYVYSDKGNEVKSFTVNGTETALQNKTDNDFQSYNTKYPFTDATYAVTYKDIETSGAAAPTTTDLTSTYKNYLNSSTTLTSIDFTGATTEGTEATVTGLSMTSHPNCLIIVNKGTTVDGIDYNVVVKDGDSYSCTKLILSDTYNSFNAPVGFTATTTAYSRTTTNSWGTVCLPYKPVKKDGERYFKYSSSTNTQITLEEVAEADLAANTPYVIKQTTPGSYEQSGSNYEVVATPSSMTLAGGWTLKGVLKNSVIYVDNDALSRAHNAGYSSYDAIQDANAYYVANGMFKSISGYFKLKPFRAYFSSSTPAREGAALSLWAPDENTPTGINTLLNGDYEIEGYYDMNGRKLSDVQKGTNVVRMKNGQSVKVMIK